MRSVRRHNPDFEYVLLNERSARELVAAHLPAMLSAYDGFPYDVQRVDRDARTNGARADVDFARYAALYVLGTAFRLAPTEALDRGHLP